MKKIFLLIVIFLIPFSLNGFDYELSRETLKDLKTFGVIIEITSESNLINVTPIQTEVELALRREGIAIIDTNWDGLLYVYILIGESSDHYIVDIETEVYQIVKIDRLGGMQVLANTWSVGNTGYIGKKLDYEKVIGDNVRDEINEFLNAYLSVNPK